MRQSNWQLPTKTSSPQSMTSPIDKFPPFNDESYDAATELGGSPLNPTVRYAPNDFWQPRKAGHIAWEYAKGSRGSKHRPRKSISEAISTIRTRNASVSANAHELAEALRAPVSYKLIVRCSVPLIFYGIVTYLSIDTLPCLVHDLGSYEYVVQVHSERSAETNYSHDCPVRFCFDMVSDAGVPFDVVSCSQASCSSTKEWYPPSIS